jgi:cbb3-type cytochrome oxidase subunit 3
MPICGSPFVYDTHGISRGIAEFGDTIYIIILYLGYVSKQYVYQLQRKNQNL